jgi:nucleotide-binding universal stress UspA family protein
MFAISTILHPTDFSPASGLAFRLASALARDHGARLVVVHVVATPVPVAAEWVCTLPAEIDWEAIEARLDRLCPEDPAVSREYRLLEGEAAPEILRLARETEADLIVMGTHGRTGLGRLLMGSVAERVVRAALCPVVTVKGTPPEDRPAAARPTPAFVARAGEGSREGHGTAALNGGRT